MGLESGRTVEPVSFYHNQGWSFDRWGSAFLVYWKSTEAFKRSWQRNKRTIRVSQTSSGLWGFPDT